jgi:hypothetical protein
MMTRLAILFAVLGQLVSSGLCGVLCGPLSSTLFAAPDVCCVAPTETSCCVVEPSEPVSCCDSEPRRTDTAPATPQPCPTCSMPCCSAPPPAVPATTSGAQPGIFAYLILAPLPAQWSLEPPEPNSRIRMHATEPPGPATCGDRLASLCVWVI